MASEEEEARRAFHALYEALDALLRGKGTQLMRAVWHHADYVSSSHPFGAWARGWDEVSATWEEGAAVWAIYQGHAQRSERIGEIHELRVTLLGDTAFGASVYKSKFYLSDGELNLKVNCTDVVHRIDGVWKVVHHHADQGPPVWQARVEQMVRRGRA
ncbi:MAG: nuclear transport factor 2 family protein [Polyangiaceae bacterium]